MATTNLPDYKTIRTEDFPPETRQMIDRIAYSINPFAEQLINILNGGLLIENLNQQVVSLSGVQVDASGDLSANNQYRLSLGSIRGHQIISVTNTTDGSAPTGAPFITYTRNNEVVTITNITGLEASKKYNIIAIAIG
jgi:hypothetical protein